MILREDNGPFLIVQAGGQVAVVPRISLQIERFITLFQMPMGSPFLRRGAPQLACNSPTRSAGLVAFIHRRWRDQERPPTRYTT